MADISNISLSGSSYDLKDTAARNEAQILAQICDGVYDGVDLTVKFADEIAGYSDAWAWIKARISDGNFTGIHVCDYIPFELNGYTYNAQVAGINTYKGWNNSSSTNLITIGNHIDFISKELYKTSFKMNQYAAYANGYAVTEIIVSDGQTSVFTLTHTANTINQIYTDFEPITKINKDTYTYDPETHKITFSTLPPVGNLRVFEDGTSIPWNKSVLKLWLNSEAGVVPGSQDLYATPVDVDYTSTGIYNSLPEALKNVITEKYAGAYSWYTIPRTDWVTLPNGISHNVNFGNLWLPSVYEVNGNDIGIRPTDNSEIVQFESVQYPIFANNMKRVKSVVGSSTNQKWWLAEPIGSQSYPGQMWGVILAGGSTAGNRTNYACYFPICFRIA